MYTRPNSVCAYYSCTLVFPFRHTYGTYSLKKNRIVLCFLTDLVGFASSLVTDSCWLCFELTGFGLIRLCLSLS